MRGIRGRVDKRGGDERGGIRGEDEGYGRRVQDWSVCQEALRDVSHSRKEKVAYMSTDFPSITH